MDMNTSMYVFLEGKQKAFDEACCAFRAANKVSAIAAAVGLDASVLRNKLNPEQPHVLTCSELVAITKASGDYTIINSLLLGLGVVTAQLPQEEKTETFLKRVLEHSMLSGDLSRMALDHGGDTRLPRTTRHKIISKAQASIGNLMLLISDLENRTSGATPFFAMSVDFITQGAPIPGLS
ncbi:phage regulatory CII family protein [Vibrio fluvialis]|nr:phage regulatory CII family protein [Vibrio fluvialis]